MSEQATAPSSRPQRLGLSDELLEGGEALVFEVMVQGACYPAFAVRYEGGVQAYINQCTHVATEMDAGSKQFFDDSGRWLVCSRHGAFYKPDSGACAGGPCQGALLKLQTSERDNQIFWHPDAVVSPLG